MTETNLTIRKASIDDRALVKVLWDKVIQDAFSKSTSNEHQDHAGELQFKMKQFDKVFRNKKSHYYLAFNGSKLVGTIAYGTPPNWGILKRTKRALKDFIEIGSLYIDPEMQNKGYGKQLLIYILETLLEAGIETVCFDSIIESSIQLWRRLFGEPKYMIPAKRSDFIYMIWVVDVKESINRLKK
ncbi:MAG: GNAT family N-acetyltransferase [Candidatus Izemoplasmataceae bacterium]